MSENEKDTKNITYRCPCCFNRFIDVTIEKDKDGIYRCLKCGFNGTIDDVLNAYSNFRSRYKLRGTRITLDEQRRM